MDRYFFKLTGQSVGIFVLLWFLLFIEPLTVGPLKISQIWKGCIVIIGFLYVIKKPLPGFILIGFAFSFKYLIYIYFPYGIKEAIQNTLEALIFPLTIGFFYLKYKNRPYADNKLIKIAIFLSLFLIYSAVPFLFGLKSLNPEMSLEKYGLESTAMKGLFYHVASASKLFTVATIVLFNTRNRFKNNFLNKIIWSLGMVLGTYFVFTSWTRTGWLIFLIGITISLFYNANIKRKFFGLILTIILGFGILFLFETNQAFRYRVTGGTTYRQNTEFSIEHIATSRLPFVFIAIDNLKDEGLIAQFLGYGSKHGIDLFDKKTGMPIVSHNGTFEILESSGFFGLSLFGIFIFLLMRKIKIRLNDVSQELRKNGVLSVVLFSGFFLTSHGTPLWGEIIYACFFTGILLDNEGYHSSNMNNEKRIYIRRSM